MRGECCGNCRFAMADGQQLLCRRMPPTAQAIFVQKSDDEVEQDEQKGMAGWPVKHVGNVAIYPPMQSHGWCGEWSPKLDS